MGPEGCTVRDRDDFGERAPYCVCEMRERPDASTDAVPDDLWTLWGRKEFDGVKAESQMARSEWMNIRRGGLAITPDHLGEGFDDFSDRVTWHLSEKRQSHVQTFRPYPSDIASRVGRA